MFFFYREVARQTATVIEPGLKIDLLKQLSEALVAKGVATLRFDKRAVSHYADHWPKEPSALANFFSWANHKDDVAGAFKALAAKPEVQGRRCSILGHSEGGLLALATESKLQPEKLVLIGTPGRPLGEVIEEQLRNLLAKQNVPQVTIKEFLEKNKAIQESIIAKGEIPEDIPDGLKPLYNPSTAKYLQEVLPLDPAAIAASILSPVLIINGERDIQVSPEKDARLLLKAFESRNAGDQELFIVPSASHNLKVVTKPDELGLEGAIEPSVAPKITGWLTN